MSEQMSADDLVYMIRASNPDDTWVIDFVDARALVWAIQKILCVGPTTDGRHCENVEALIIADRKATVEKCKEVVGNMSPSQRAHWTRLEAALDSILKE